MQKNWFKKIQKTRKDGAKILDKEFLKGVKETVTNSYSDKAHFIFELIQNADDVKATQVAFKLMDDGLEFTHNGKERFSLSNPENETNDKINGCLGHINAITSIGNSNKINDERIGKFGIGFKSVFSYTNTPHIFDSDFQFKIQDYIVPIELIEKKHIKKNYTEFWFPFDKKDLNPKQAYKEILNKLKNLNETLLFLNHVKKIRWSAKRDSGEQSFKVKSNEKIENIYIQYISYKLKTNNIIKSSSFYKFSKKIAGTESWHDSVVFLYDNKKKIILPQSKKAFCFFETKHKTDLNFIINAPFKLTFNREGLINSEEADDWNTIRLKSLAKLSAASIKLMSNHIDNIKVNSSILNIIPLKEIYINDDLNFSIFYDEILDTFKSNRILSSRSGDNIETSKAYWSKDTDLINLVSDNKLSKIVRKENCAFVYTDIIKLNDSNKSNYIEKIVQNRISGFDFINKITAVFSEKQSEEWLIRLYRYIHKKHIIQQTSKAPIFILENGQAKSKLDKNNNLQIFLPDINSNKSSSIHSRFNNQINLLKKLGFKLPNEFDELFNKTLPHYKRNEFHSKRKLNLDFKKIFNCWNNVDSNKKIILENELKFLNFIKTDSNDKILFRAEETHLRSEQLSHYFNENLKKKIKYADINYYEKLINKDLKNHLAVFLNNIGMNVTPRIFENNSTKPGKINGPKRGYVEPKKIARRSNQFFIEKEILGCHLILEEITKNNDDFKSNILWKTLLNIVKRFGVDKFKEHLQAIHRYSWRKNKLEKYYESEIVYKLKTKKWLRTHSGEWKSPSDISISELDKTYEIDEKCNLTLSLRKYLGLKGIDSNKIDFKKKLEEETKQKVVLACDEEEQKALEEFRAKRRAKFIEEDFTPTINDKNLDTISSIPFDLRALKSNSVSKTKHISKSKKSNKTEITVRRKRSSKYLKQVGDFGEGLVQKDLEKEFSSNLHKVINLNNSNSTGVGYDFEVKFKEETIRYVEVKTTVDNESSKVKLSGAQWEFAKKLHQKNKGDKLFVYCVFNAGNENMSIKYIQNPYELFIKGKLKAHKVELIISED